MFDKDALERLHEMFAALINRDNPDFAVLPGNCTTKSLEAYLEAPKINRRTFKTKYPDQFIDYCLDQDGINGAEMYVNPEEGSAICIFDHDGWCKDLAKLELKKSVEFSALIRAEDVGALSQRRAAAFISDFNKNICPLTGVDEQFSAKMYSAIHSLKVSDTSDIGVSISNSGVDTSLSRSTAVSSKQHDEFQLPEEFIFKCATYDGLDEDCIRVKMDLSESSKDTGIVVKLRTVGLHMIMEFAGTKIKTLIKRGFDGENVNIYLGNLSLPDWYKTV